MRERLWQFGTSLHGQDREFGLYYNVIAIFVEGT